MGWFTKVKKGFVNSFGNIRLYGGGVILWGKSGYGIDGGDQRSILDQIQPGDIIYRRYKHYVGSMAVPGYWSHVALYVGEPYNVIHAVGGGVSSADILTFMRTDSLALMRCTDKSLIPGAIEYAKKKLEAQTPYDWDFRAENDALYCSELIWEGFNRPECDKFQDKFVVPDNLLSVNEFELLIEIKK